MGHHVTTQRSHRDQRSHGVDPAMCRFFMLCYQPTNIYVKEVTHIPCDRLSQRGLDPKMSIAAEAAELGIPDVRVVEMNGDDNEHCEIMRPQNYPGIGPAIYRILDEGETCH